MLDSLISHLGTRKQITRQILCLCVSSPSKLSYPKLEVLHPLSYHLVLCGGGVGHLELEQVVASWSVTVLVKHNRGASTACTEQEKENVSEKNAKSRWCDWVQQTTQTLCGGTTQCVSSI